MHFCFQKSNFYSPYRTENLKSPPNHKEKMLFGLNSNYVPLTALQMVLTFLKETSFAFPFLLPKPLQGLNSWVPSLQPLDFLIYL